MYASQLSSLRSATAPPERRGLPRDEVRMLVTHRQSGANEHRRFTEVSEVLRPGDLLVVNDSATVPASLCANRSSGHSLTLHVSTQVDERLWLTEPRESVLRGEELALPGGGSVVTIAPADPEHPRLWYSWFQLPQPMHAYLARHGKPIRYRYVTDDFPIDDYQTIFAREPGSSEMPSAARPFSTRVVTALKARGVEIVAITLHCGVASLEEPERPAAERYRVSPETAAAVNRARAEGRRVIAIGSTPLRALESSFYENRIVASSGWTGLVIDQRHPVRTIDGLLSGFHQTTATHQSILRTFLGCDTLAAAYAEAAENGYYQHEFGDVHLML